MKAQRWLLGKWHWSRPFKFLALLYLSLIVVACSFANKIIFLPPPPQYEVDEADLQLLDPGDEQVAAFYLPPRDDQQPVLLWAHGNAEDIGLLKPLFDQFHSEGLGVLGYDYPGYGHSAGSPNENSCYRAAQRAYDFLTREQQIAPGRIILVGQSVGSGPACWLAERNPAGAVVLITPFLSAFRTLTHIPLVPGDIFKNLKRIKKITQPLIVIHGSSDEAIPYRQGQRLYKEHRGPKRFVEIPGAGHNNIWTQGHSEITSAIKAALDLTDR